MPTPSAETSGRRGKLVASSKLPSRRRLRRVPTAAVVVGLVVAVAAAITGAASPLPALSFVSPGHWVYSSLLGAAVHVDGATGSVDAGAKVPAAPDAQVVQGDSSGYVVDSGRITVFGKSDLNVTGTMAPPSNEVPTAVEGAGGPYLVYRQAGKVTRLGDQPATILAGGPLAEPVLTGDGTLWLLRTDNGRVCELLSGSRTLGCPAEAPAGHTGALSLLAGQPNYVDTTAGQLYQVGDKGFGPATKISGPTGPHVQPSATDVDGRLALLDPDSHTLSLVDPNTPTAAPVTVRLPKGDYAGPTAGGSVVAVVDRTTNTVRTYDDRGKERGHRTMPKEAGEPRLTTGDDHRVYVEGTKGTHVMVVGDEGAVDDVPLNRAPDRPDSKPSTEDNKGPGGALPGEHDQRSQDQQQQQRQQQEPPKPPEHKPLKPPTHEPPTQHGPDDRPDPTSPPPVVDASPPGAPSGVRADASSTSATLHWSAPNDNGSPITGYHVTWKSSAGSGSRDVGAGSRSTTVSGLTSGTSYTFTVAAENAKGRGAATSAKAVKPAAAASAPSVLPIYDQSNGNALVSWKAPASMGGGTFVEYTVTMTGLGQRTTPETSLIVTNLPHDGRPVTFTVRAVTKTSSGQRLTGAPGSFTWPGSTDGGGSGGPQIKITRGEKVCPDHPDEPTCARMHVVMTGFEPNKEYSIAPHSSNGDYHADNAHYTMDDNGSRTFDTFQYYWTGDTVWVSTKADGNTVESNHMPWTAS